MLIMKKSWIDMAFRLSKCYPYIFVFTVISEHVETVVLVEFVLFASIFLSEVTVNKVTDILGTN